MAVDCIEGVQIPVTGRDVSHVVDKCRSLVITHKVIPAQRAISYIDGIGSACLRLIDRTRRPYDKRLVGEGDSQWPAYCHPYMRWIAPANRAIRRIERV